MLPCNHQSPSGTSCVLVKGHASQHSAPDESWTDVYGESRKARTTERSPQPGSLWNHWKTGLVEVLQPDHDSKDDVIRNIRYRHLVGGSCYHRPIEEWHEVITRDNYHGPRFTQFEQKECGIPQVYFMSIRYSTETIVNYSCGSCNKWFSISGGPIDGALTCPHCDVMARIEVIPS